MSNKKYSLLYPLESAEYKKLSPTALHDLGLDQICKQRPDTKGIGAESDYEYDVEAVCRSVCDTVPL